MRNPSIEPLESRIAPAVISFAGPVEITEGQNGQADMVFKVMLDSPSPLPLTVKVSTLDGTATVADGDYTRITDQIIEFPANTVEKTFVVKINGDTNFEPDENFSVVLSSPSAGHTIGAASTATGTILKGSDTAPTLSIVNASVGEKNSGTQQLKFTVSLSNKSSEAISFEWGTQDLPAEAGNAVAGSDYTAVPAGTVVTINPGQTTAEIVVDILPDRSVEPNEKFEVQLANPRLVNSLTELSFATGTTGKAVGTIVNDEPTVSLGITTSPTPNEGTSSDTTVNFRVNLSVAASEDIVVKLSTIAAASGIQATPGEDFTALLNKEFTIQAGQTFVNVPVTIKGDAVHEGNESFALSIVEVDMGGQLLTPSVVSREVTILNDEARPTLSVQSASLVEPTGTNSVMNFTVTLSNAADKDITLDWNTLIGTATGLDFTEVSVTTVSIPAGQKTITLPVTILTDSLAAEGNESFRVVIANGMLDGLPISTTVGGSEATGTIRENALSVSVVGPTAGETEGTSGADRTAVFTVKRGDTDSLAEAIIVRVSTVDGSATKAGNDYRSLNNVPFTIPAGVSSIVVTVGINPDNIDEGSEDFSLRIDSVEIGGASFQGFSTALASATILDDDAAPRLSISDVSTAEGHLGTKTVAFVVSLSTIATEDITFDYVTEFSTGANAADGNDFVAVSVPVRVTIPAGQSSKSVDLTINGDTVREASESFNVRISNPLLGGAAMANDAISDDTGVVNIQPDEPTATIAGPVAGVAEGSTTDGKTNLTFTVTLDRVQASPTAVRVSTVNGTALAGEDFEALAGKWVLIPAGSQSATFTVAALHDQKVEAQEAFTVEVNEVRVGVGTALDSNQLPTGGGDQPQDGAVVPATGTINNDDLATLSVSDASLVEGAAGVSQMAFTVTLSKPASQDVTFKYSTANGTAEAGVDFQGITGALGTIPAGSTTVTVFVNINGDSSIERDETFTVSLSEAKFGTNPEVITFADGVGQGTILSDEITVSIESTKTVAENTPGAVALAVSLSAASAHAIQITLSLTNGTATKGTDFNDPGELIVTIPAGQTTANVSVPILNDTVFETDETFDVYLVGVTNAQLGAATRGTVTIDSEDAIPELTITGESKNEGTKSSLNDSDFTTFTFTASLNRASGSPVTFDWKTLALVGGINATAGIDFVAVPTTLVTIPAGSPSATFTVQVSKEVFNEAINEADELLTVEVSNVSGAVLKDPDVGSGTVKTLASTIRNDEDLRTISFGDARFVEGDSGVGMMEFVVSLSGRADRDVTFSWQTSSGGSNPATAGDDYTSVALTSATIVAGTTEARLSVPVIGDTNLERDETFIVSISDVRIGGVAMTVADVDSEGTIRNDELVASIAPIDAAKLVIEGDDVVSTPDEEFVEARIPITLSQAVPANQTVTVGWKFVTAGTTASIDVDYKADNFVVVFAAGETTKDIVVKVRPDLLSELNETFKVELNDATTINAIASSVDNSSVVTIQDNEAAPVISIDDSGALESDGTITFTIKLDRVASSEIRVDIETVDDTAVSSGVQSDFTAKAKETIKFAPGETTKTYSVAVNNDLDNTELIERFLVRLSNAVTGTLEGGGTTFEAVGTIASPNYSSIKVSDLSINEGSQAGTPAKLEFVVTRTGSTEKDVTGVYNVTFDALLSAGFSAADAADISSLLSGNFTIPAGASSTKILLEIAGDTVVEGDEKFRIRLGNVVDAIFKNESDSVATGTLVDDDLTIRFRDSGDVSRPSIISQAEGNTGTTNMAFHFDLNDAAPKDIEVTFRVAGVTAESSKDFNLPTSLKVIIPKGQTSGVFNIPVIGDATAESLETFTVTIDSAPGARIDDTAKVRTGEILNDDATFKILGDKRIEEGQSGARDLVFDVELSGVTVVPGTEYTVDFETLSGTASSGQDFTATTGTLRFVATGTQQIRVPIIGDTSVENDESFTVKLTNSKFNSQVIDGIFTQTATGTIQDDETSISIGNASLTEGNSGQQLMNFVVSLPIASSIPIIVTYSTADVTALGVGADVADRVGKDYISATGRTLTINPGQVTGIISIPILGDLVNESAETFEVRITQVSGAVASDAVGEGTINPDNDVVPTLSIADAKIVEGDSGTATMKFKVSLSHAASEVVSFKWATADGTAGSADYTQQALASATIPVGAVSVELSVPIIGDTAIEGNETFSVVITDPKIVFANPIIQPVPLTLSDGTAIGTIEDDDATLRVKAGESTLSVAEETSGATPVAGKARVALDLGLPLGGTFDGSLTVTYTITAPSGTGDTAASASKDYVVPASTTKTFAAGTSLADMFIEVDLLADSIDEWDEKFVVTITGVTGARLDPDADDLKSVVTITDNDEAPKLQINGVQVQESSTAGANFVVRLSGNVTERDIAIRWDALSFTAFAGSDFTARENQNVTIAAGSREATLNVPVINDTADEGDETFRVALSSAQFSKTGTTEDVLFVDETAANAGTKRTAIGTILKNDSRVVTVTGGTVLEGVSGGPAKTIDFKIVLDAAPSSSPITVNYSTDDGSATAGNDYVAKSGSVTFAVGEKEKTIQVSIVSDDLAELDENFKFRISLPGGSDAVLGGTSEAIGTIDADESIFSLERVLAVGETAEVTEGGKAKFKVVRTGATNLAATVNFEATENSALASSIKALGTIDFSRLTGSISFPANQSDSSAFNQFIEVNIADDSVAESSNEQFLVRLTNATNGIISSTDGEKSVTIIDNDAGPDPLVRISSASVNEGGSVSFIVKLLTDSGEALTAKYPVRITYAAILGTSGNVANAADFTSAFSESTRTLEIPVGATQGTITIATLQDTTPETSETFEVELTKVEKVFGATTEIANPFLPENALTPRAGSVKAVGTILNDDSVITVSPVSQFEGTGTATPMVFVASIPQPANFPITFHYKTKLATGAGAASAADFTEVEGDVTIPAGQTQAPFQVAITPDTAREGNEIFNIELSAPVDGILANANSEGKAVVLGTILNDDAGPQITISSTSIEEVGAGGTSLLTFTVSLTGDTTGDVSVNFATSDGTAKSSGAIIDYIAKNGTVTFAPHTGSTPATKVIEIVVHGDDWKEGDETMTVTLSDAIGGAEIATTTATGTITDGTDSKVGVFLSGASVVEGGSASFKLGVTALPSEAVTFTVNTRNGSADAADFTAISSRVYTLNGSSLSFINASGESQSVSFDTATLSATIPVSTRADSNFEASENFHLDVTEATGSSAIPSAGRSASAIIYNDDIRILNGREFEFIDEDGDLVNVKFSKGTLFTVNAFGQFQDRGLVSLESAGSVGGRSLSTINLLGTGREFEGANISVTRKAQAGFDLPTDGKVNVGAIVAARASTASLQDGVNLGAVKVQGDLGRIVVGSTLNISSISKLEVDSLGVFADTASDGISEFYGRAGSILVHGNMEGNIQLLGTIVNLRTGVVSGLGSVSSLKIGGKLIGGDEAQLGGIFSNASISKLSIGGIVGGDGDFSGRILAQRSIGNLVILGDIEGGDGKGSGQIVSQTIGNIKIGEAASRGRAAIEASILGGDGGGDVGEDGDVVSRQVGSGAIISYSTIKSVTMQRGGSVEGGDGKNSGMIFAQGNISKMALGSIVGGAGVESGRVRSLGSIGSLSADTILGGSASNAGSVEAAGRISSISVENILGPTGVLTGTSDVVRSGTVVAGDLGNVIVKGMVGRGTATGATLVSSGSIISSSSIDSLTVKGSMTGIDQSQPVTIFARNDIGRIDIGTMKFAEILAGYEASTSNRGNLKNSDAQIGTVVIGEYAGGSIVAGISAGDNGQFGTSDDVVPTSGVTNSSQIISRIASITVKTLNANGVTDPAGFVAQKIGAVKVAGVRIPFTSDGPFAINGTQVFINEV